MIRMLLRNNMASERFVIGIDIGGTSIKGALFDNASIIMETKLPTKPDPLSSLIGVIETLLSDPNQATLIGIASAGDIDENGLMKRCYNIPQIENQNLKEITEGQFGIPTFVLNDAKAALIAELTASNLEGNAALLTFGTGVGCGVRVDGKIYQGGQYDFGHMILEPDGPLCGCGKRGCAESLVSATALLNQARAAYGFKFTLPKLIQKLDKGDRRAQAIFERFGKRVSKFIDTIAASINGIVILGGGMMELHAHFDRFINPKEGTYRYAVLGNRSGAFGAMEYALEKKETK